MDWPWVTVGVVAFVLLVTFVLGWVAGARRARAHMSQVLNPGD